MSLPVPNPVHSWVRELIEDELVARKWKEPVFIISQLAQTSESNVTRLLRFDHRLTRIECWIIDTAFGLSDGFMSRFQSGCEKKYPENHGR